MSFGPQNTSQFNKTSKPGRIIKERTVHFSPAQNGDAEPSPISMTATGTSIYSGLRKSHAPQVPFMKAATICHTKPINNDRTVSLFIPLKQT